MKVLIAVVMLLVGVNAQASRAEEKDVCSEVARKVVRAMHVGTSANRAAVSAYSQAGFDDNSDLVYSVTISDRRGGVRKPEVSNYKVKAAGDKYGCQIFSVTRLAN